MPVALTDEQNEERTAAIRKIFNESTAKRNGEANKPRKSATGFWGKNGML